MIRRCAIMRSFAFRPAKFGACAVAVAGGTAVEGAVMSVVVAVTLALAGTERPPPAPVFGTVTGVSSGWEGAVAGGASMDEG